MNSELVFLLLLSDTKPMILLLVVIWLLFWNSSLRELLENTNPGSFWLEGKFKRGTIAALELLFPLIFRDRPLVKVESLSCRFPRLCWC